MRRFVLLCNVLLFAAFYEGLVPWTEPDHETISDFGLQLDDGHFTQICGYIVLSSTTV